MPLSVRNMVAILATIVILLGVFFIATLYLPTRKQARRTAQRRVTLEAQVEAAAPTGGEREQEAAIIDAIGMDIDFSRDGSSLLERAFQNSSSRSIAWEVRWTFDSWR